MTETIPCRQSRFLDLVGSVELIFKEDPGAIIWTEAFSTNLHRQSNFGISTFRNAVKSIRKSVFILSPLDRPLIFQNTWSLFAMYTAIAADNSLSNVTLAASKEDMLYMDAGDLEKLLAPADFSKSQAGTVKERVSIFEELLKEGLIESLPRCFVYIDFSKSKSVNSTTGMSTTGELGDLSQVTESTDSPVNIQMGPDDLPMSATKEFERTFPSEEALLNQLKEDVMGGVIRSAFGGIYDDKYSAFLIQAFDAALSSATTEIYNKSALAEAFFNEIMPSMHQRVGATINFSKVLSRKEEIAALQASIMAQYANLGITTKAALSALVESELKNENAAEAKKSALEILRRVPEDSINLEYKGKRRESASPISGELY